MAGRVFRRLARLRIRNATEGADALPGDIVRAIWGGPIGFVYSVSDTHAVVWWHTANGYREIIELRHLKRAAADPSFGPDVRDDG